MNFDTIESLRILLGVDIVLFVTCSLILFLRGGLTFAHPAFFYLFYHLYCNTFRLYSIINGAPTMYEDLVQNGYEAVTLYEIGRAMLWMDVGLILFTIGCVIAYARVPSSRQQLLKLMIKPPVMLNRKVVLWVCVVCFPFGLITFLSRRGGLDVDLGEFGKTAYSSLATLWPLATMSLGVYFLGFRWWLVLPLVAYLSVVGLQGYHRFMLLLPVLLLTNIYIFRKNLRWPPIPICFCGVILFAIFPYLKYIGRAFQEGDTTMVKSLVTEGGKKVLTGDKDTSQDFLDQFACVMTLTDRNQQIYWGANYFALMTYPVPRLFWPDKPTITQFMADIGTDARPIHKEGRIPTFMGDAYVNFREPGMIVFPLALGFFLSRWALSCALLPHESLRRLIYVIFAPALIQVWRDGLCSLVFFTFIHFMPILFIFLLHLFPGIPRKMPPLSPMQGNPRGPAQMMRKGRGNSQVA